MTEEITNEEITYRNKFEKEIRELTDKYRDLFPSPTIGSMLIIFGALLIKVPLSPEDAAQLIRHTLEIADEALNDVKENLKKYKETKND